MQEAVEEFEGIKRPTMRQRMINSSDELLGKKTKRICLVGAAAGSLLVGCFRLELSHKATIN